MWGSLHTLIVRVWKGGRGSAQPICFETSSLKVIQMNPDVIYPFTRQALSAMCVWVSLWKTDNFWRKKRKVVHGEGVKGKQLPSGCQWMNMLWWWKWCWKRRRIYLDLELVNEIIKINHVRRKEQESDRQGCLTFGGLKTLGFQWNRGRQTQFRYVPSDHGGTI